MRSLKGVFSLGDDETYARWRDEKWTHFPKNIDALKVEVKDLAKPKQSEVQAIKDRVRRAGMAIYQSPPIDDIEKNKARLQDFSKAFGLTRLDANPYADEDAITLLHQAKKDEKTGRKLYIPYTNRALNWHTDGYYNAQDRPVRSIVLHCVQAAGVSGGLNFMFDSHMAYILMRESDPRMIDAFFHTQALTIPRNDVDDQVARGDISGPVFSVQAQTGELFMRYTARKHAVVWANDQQTDRAVCFMKDMLGRALDKTFTETPHSFEYGFEYGLSSGEGIISNNILHGRTSFEDLEGEKNTGHRMMLRARYLDAIPSTV